jgi:hypothetical protein
VSFAQLVAAVHASSSAPAPPAGGDVIDSDDFSGGIGDWTLRDDLGGSSAASVGTGTSDAFARITLSAVSHNFSDILSRAVSLRKAALDADGTVVVKLQSALSADDRGFGMAIQASSGTYVAVHMYRFGGANTAEAFPVTGNVRGTVNTAGSASGAYLRIARSGNNYQAAYSSDGSSWTNVGSAISQTMTVTLVSFYALNFGSNPAAVLDFDWIEDSAMPISPEDPV